MILLFYKRKLEKTIVGVSRLACGSCLSPHACHGTFKYSPLWATTVSHRYFWWAALTPKVPAWSTGQAQALLGKVSHTSRAARSCPEAAGKVKLQSMLWDRGCRRNHGELTLFHTLEWELVSYTSWRGLSMPGVWCICRTLDVYLKIPESRCNELFQLACLILKAQTLILYSVKTFLILCQKSVLFKKKMQWVQYHY